MVVSPPVRPGHEGRVDVATDEQDPPILAALDEGIGEIEPVKKTGTLLPDVEGGDRLPQAQTGLHQRTVSREEKVGSHRGEDHRIDVGRLPAGSLKG